jgi:hypothetical protein
MNRAVTARALPRYELNRLRAERQAERRRLFARQAADAAQVTYEEEGTFRQAMESQREAARLLSPQVGVIKLDHPLEIFCDGPGCLDRFRGGIS